MKLSAIMLPPFLSISLHLILLFTLKLTCFQPNIAVTAAFLGNETDHMALLKFKESISDDPYDILVSWNSSTHFCYWNGVYCGQRHQRVTQFILNGYYLHGFLSPFIGNLSFLKILSLENNFFHGEIPQELGRLFRLQIISLSNNTLSGQIPINMTNYSKLRILDFGGNQLTGRISMEIGSLYELEGLYLWGNNLTGQIPDSLWNLSSLNDINLNYNNLEGNITEEIGHLKNLTRLAVGANGFSGPLPFSLYNLSSLTLFAASFNQFSGSLPANMFLTLPNIREFEIDANQISGNIPTSIANASKLQILGMSYNQFVGQVPSLGKLTYLSRLMLSGNYLGSNLTKDWEFLTSLVNCSKLDLLNVRYNNFGGHLPDNIGNLSNQLTQLYLDRNQISGKVPTALENLLNLIVLHIGDNDFTGVIPNTFGKFQKMQGLYMGYNRLSGEIPPSLGNLSQLFKLDLSKNMLEGHIPPNLGNCHSLQYLDLSQNNLIGSIPEEVIGLSSLSILLNLSHNSLSGDLPALVGKLNGIGKLDVSRNHLSGRIPETIGDCLSLEYLYLQRNSFQEIVPLSLASLKGLRHLDLSQNNLSGSIPKGLQDILVLEYLNVSFNILEGEVPNKGVFANSSAISVIGNSKLCGGISELELPPCKVTENRKNHRFMLLIVICFVVAIFLLLSSIFIIYHMRKRKSTFSSNSPTSELFSKVSYQALHNATNGFSVNKLIGYGSFGSVYRVTLESQDVAVKVFNLQTKGAHKSFMAECNALRSLRHRNLVKILTCCSTIDYKGQDFKALVFEYLVNGSLEKWLHPEEANHPKIFDLVLILNIIIDVASALQYLHHESEPPIIHCDLKPSNILLDGDMVAHVSDFGLASLLPTSKGIFGNQSSTIGIKGTIGYAPPEYGMGSEPSIQGDLYSFGILVLEMVTGKRPTEDMFKDGHNLHNYVKIVFPDKFLQIVNPIILPKGSKQIAEESQAQENMTMIYPKVEKCLFSLFKIGLACSVESPKERMGIMNVTRELNLIKNSFLIRGCNII